MIRLRLSDRYLEADTLPPRALRLITRATSYPVEGARFSEAYRARRWDGRERLLKFSVRAGCFRLPLGLASEALRVLDEAGLAYAVEDGRRRLRKTNPLPWGGDPLRAYQTQAAGLAARGFEVGGTRFRGGILKMAIRSGKTRTAAAIVAKLGRPTLFVVPSQLLLRQTIRAFAEVLPRVDIGAIGDGEWSPAFVTVATAQSLVSARRAPKKSTKRERYLETIEAFDVVIFDECHHLEGDEWRGVMLDVNARWKIGLTATCEIDTERENDKASIWLRACTGPILFEVSSSELIDQGFLVRPEIRIVPCYKPDLRRRGWSPKLARDALYMNPERNELIARSTDALVRVEGRRVLVDSGRLDQVASLRERLEARGLRVGVLTGSTRVKEREGELAKFKQGRLDVLLGTVLGEGVDVPEIDAVVNAEGGRSAIATVQRLRCLTPFPGKADAIVVDFADLTNEIFAEHSGVRLATYRREPAFKIRAWTPSVT